jgi:hypothetical protein
MPSYLVESYATDGSLEREREHARLAAALGSGIRYVRTTFLPGDEMLLHLFEAPSIEALQVAGRRASLHYERIVDAVDAADESRKEHER